MKLVKMKAKTRMKIMMIGAGKSRTLLLPLPFSVSSLVGLGFRVRCFATTAAVRCSCLHRKSKLRRHFDDRWPSTPAAPGCQPGTRMAGPEPEVTTVSL